ncbi:MAG: hypothetical protein ABIP07_03355 [Sphingomicrobium sp.]
MTRVFTGFVLASALLLAACGGSDQDRLSGNLEGAEGTATVNDAELNGMIDGDREVAEMPQAPSAAAPPPEVPLADVVDPLAPAPASGPSFDCSGAWRDVERLICDDPRLAALDRTMAARYFRALKAADPARAALLQQSGAAFIRDRNRCPDAECIAQAYDERIAEIANIMGGSR